MTNQQIINKRFKTINRLLSEYLIAYKTENIKTQDDLQDVLNLIDVDYSSMNNNIPKQLKDRLDRQLSEWQKKGLFTNIFGYKASKALNRQHITYAEMLDILIMGLYVNENQSLNTFQQNLFSGVIEDGYEQAIEEIQPRKKLKIKQSVISMLLEDIILGVTINEYLYSMALSNANETYKQSLILMRSNARLSVNGTLFANLFKKQRNRLISIKKGAYSGGLENCVETLSSRAFIQAGIDTNTQQCRFIAEIDDETTLMCKNLNNKLFYLKKENVFDRYFGANKNDLVLRRTKVFGMVLGINLPPITDHFHWCRSTITYQVTAGD